MAEAVSNKKKTVYQQIGFNLRNKPAKCYIWRIDLRVLELRHRGKWCLESFKNVVLGKNLHDNLDGSCDK
jgi:hypothetical protein